MTYAFARFSSLGDVVLTTAFARALGEAAPSARVIAITRSEFAPVYMGGGVSELWTLGEAPPTASVPMRGFETVSEIAPALRERHLEAFFDLHGKPATRWLARRSGAARVVTYHRRSIRRRLAVWLGLRSRRRPQVAQAYVNCLSSAGITVSSDRFETRWFLQKIDRDAAESVMRGRGSCVAMAPGARHATKRWPAKHYAALGAALARGGTRIALLGSRNEESLCREIAASVPNATVLAGSELSQSAAVLERCDALVTGDSGLLHVAESVGTPVVALFGPTTSDFGFFPYRPNSVALEKDLPCRSCSLHGGPRCPLGHLGCLEAISPAQVLATLRPMTQKAA